MVLLLSVTKNNYLNVLLIQECVRYCALVLAVLSLLFSLEVLLVCVLYLFHNLCNDALSNLTCVASC